MIHVCIVDPTMFGKPLERTLTLMAPDMRYTLCSYVPRDLANIDILVITSAQGEGTNEIQRLRQESYAIPIISMSVTPWRKDSMLQAGANAHWEKSGLHEDVEALVALIRDLTTAS